MAAREEGFDRAVIVGLELRAVRKMQRPAGAADGRIDAHFRERDVQAQPLADDLDNQRVAANAHRLARGGAAVIVDGVELGHSAMSMSKKSATSSPATLTRCAWPSAKPSSGPEAIAVVFEAR